MTGAKHNPILRILTNPKLERIRVYVPYPLYVALLTTLLAIPIVALQRLPWPWIVVLPPAGGGILGLVYSALAIAGRLSGYHPFRVEWSGLGQASALQLSQSLRREAETLGFTTVWQGSDGGFVAVLGIEREAQRALHAPQEAPIRASFRLSGHPPHMGLLVLEGRTIVVWDTGESKRLNQLGSILCGQAHANGAPKPDWEPQQAA